MKRSAPLQRKTPMKARSLLKPSLRSKIGKTQGVWKKAKPKMTPIRKSAKDENCTLRLPMVCRQEPGNVVWAHSNSHLHGKGMGLKAEDQYGCYACFWCHQVLDGQAPRPAGMTEEFVDLAFERAMQESREILRHKGLVGE